MKLLTPGPVTLTPRVRQALLRDDVCHREPEFAALTSTVMAALAGVYADAAEDHAAVLLSGSGTSAVEAMIGSLVPRDGHALVVANGVYGERIVEILTTQGRSLDVVRSAWTAPVDLEAVAARLAHGGVSHVIAVHHETTTGRLNDVAALGALCSRHGVPLLLDAVSSFGAEDIRFGEWNLEACAATAGKCLHGVPGVAFVVARRRTLAEPPSRGTSIALDLFRHWRAQRTGYWPFTPPVHALFALDEALGELAERGGWEERRAQYRARSRQVMTGLERVGVRTLLDSRAYGSALTSYLLPDSMSYGALHDRVKRDGFVIYAGQGDLRDRIFRVAVMGDIDTSELERFVACIGTILR